ADTWTLHGITENSSVVNREILLHNNDLNTNFFYVKHNSTTCPTAASRFYFPKAWRNVDDTVILPPGAYIRLRYTSGLGWEPIASAGIMVCREFFLAGAAATPGKLNTGSATLDDGSGNGLTTIANQNGMWLTNNIDFAFVTAFQLPGGSVV